MGVEVTSCDMDDQSEMKRDAIAKVKIIKN
jgi:hypothetical protein